MGYFENESLLNRVADGNTLAWMQDKEEEEHEEDCECDDCVQGRIEHGEYLVEGDR